MVPTVYILLFQCYAPSIQVLRQYNDYLKEQMVKEAENEAQYDEIRQKAEARIWDQRDAQLKAQRDARESLMHQVRPATLLPLLQEDGDSFLLVAPLKKSIIYASAASGVKWIQMFARYHVEADECTRTMKTGVDSRLTFFSRLLRCFIRPFLAGGEQVHLGRQEQIRLKALREDDQLAADFEQARLDREKFLAEEERERQKEMRRRQVKTPTLALRVRFRIPARARGGSVTSRAHRLWPSRKEIDH